jgi:hypothetical protein
MVNVSSFTPCSIVGATRDGRPASFGGGRKPESAVARIDNVFGDRNLVCTCVGMDAYKE